MIVSLTGTLIATTPTTVVLDVNGVGFELGISASTARALPATGEAGVTLLVRMVVREDALALYGFATAEERVLFDKLCAISGVGPKLALSVLSTFSAEALAEVVAAKDATRMATVPGVGKKLAGRMLLELESAFARDTELQGLLHTGDRSAGDAPGAASATGTEAEVISALLSMGFTPQEATLAVEGHEDAGATTTEAMVAYALRKLGGGI